MSERPFCGYCGLEIHKDDPMDHLGDSVGHRGKQRCLELLQRTIQDLRSRLRVEQACEVCWTNSWDPVTTEAECTIAHPHWDGNETHVRCGMCLCMEALRDLREKLATAEIENREILEYCSLLEGGLGAHEARDTVWPEGSSMDTENKTLYDTADDATRVVILTNIVDYLKREKAETEAKLRQAQESIKTLRMWANCGGVESTEVCSAPEEPGHKIFGPYNILADGTFRCEFHNFKEQIVALTESLATAQRLSTTLAYVIDALPHREDCACLQPDGVCNCPKGSAWVLCTEQRIVWQPAVEAEKLKRVEAAKPSQVKIETNDGVITLDKTDGKLSLKRGPAKGEIPQ